VNCNCVQLALSTAAEQQAKLWELRAAANLACLRRNQGCRGEARDLLGAVYGWFTEGSKRPISKRRRRCSTSRHERRSSPGYV
jgi:predicted ATPase